MKDCPAELVLLKEDEGGELVADKWFCTATDKHIVHRANGAESYPCFYWSSFDIDTSK